MDKQALLLEKISQTVLSKKETKRYQLLIRRLEACTMTDAEYDELMQLTDYEEKIRYERLTYLSELAELKSMRLYDLMDSLGLNRPLYA
jgi:DNA topoisomerase IA